MCGELNFQGDEISVYDNVPSADLAWEGAEQTDAQDLEIKQSKHVRIGGVVSLMPMCVLPGTWISAGSPSLPTFVGNTVSNSY